MQFMKLENGSRELAGTLSRRRMFAIGAVALGGLVTGRISAKAGDDDGVFQKAESIHQEPLFKAPRKRVYEALMSAAQFRRVIQLSAAAQSGQALGNKPVEISRHVGGPFALFGGHIVGWQLELLPNERIVQAWRVVDWDPGVYSVAKFQLADHTSGTKIVFDHTGFPPGLGRHLAAGWNANYWQPQQIFLT